MKNLVKFVFSMLIMAFLGTPMNAQTALVDHWPTSEQAIAATSAQFYYPKVVHQQKLAENEVLGGLSHTSAVEMKLPDRMSGRGWVRIEAGRRFVFDKNTSQVLRLAECNNEVFGVVSIPQAEGQKGNKGEKGDQGDTGAQGPKISKEELDAALAAALRRNPPVPQQPNVPPVTKSRKGWYVVGAVVLGVVVYSLTKKHGSSPSSTGPGGSTGPGH